MIGSGARNGMAIDFRSLWDFSNPALSEQRFRDALELANFDDALILKTQIARTYGLRKDFDTARQLLAEVEPYLASASAQVQVRYWLELGRSYASATHPPESQTDAAKAQARLAYTRAFDVAKASALEGLAIDALHMMPFVDTDPQSQLDWNLKALAYLESSTQADARKWEASLRNNVGYALKLQKRYAEAVAQFELSREASRRDGNVTGVRIQNWMIASAYREMGRLKDALDIQLELEREWEAAGEPDPYVFEELEAIYRTMGDEARATHYADALRRSREPQ